MALDAHLVRLIAELQRRRVRGCTILMGFVTRNAACSSLPETSAAEEGLGYETRLPEATVLAPRGGLLIPSTFLTVPCLAASSGLARWIPGRERRNRRLSIAVAHQATSSWAFRLDDQRVPGISTRPKRASPAGRPRFHARPNWKLEI